MYAGSIPTLASILLPRPGGGIGRIWWAPSETLIQAYTVSESRPLHVIVRGVLSPPGQYGHLGGYERCFTNIEVIKVINAKDSASGN